jgi:glutamine amidotransferase
MCRLYGFLANEPTKVECTLVYAQNALMIQSHADRRGVAHADGWGVAWYENGCAPAVERRDTAAYQDTQFSRVAERVFATTVVAHVRKATVGSASPHNTHPFRHGPWIFAHNGTVRGFERVGPRIASETPADLRPRRRGDTDSEAVFLWLLGRMREVGIDIDRETPDPVRLSTVVRESVGVLAARSAAEDGDEPPKLNFVVTDGRTLVATRWQNSLYWLRREGVHDCELCGIPHVRHERGAPYRALLVASEPITREEWTEMPEASAILMDPDLQVTIDPIEPEVAKSQTR